VRRGAAAAAAVPHPKVVAVVDTVAAVTHNLSKKMS
jgi:hypothetical protein